MKTFWRSARSRVGAFVFEAPLTLLWGYLGPDGDLKLFAICVAVVVLFAGGYLVISYVAEQREFGPNEDP